MDIGLVANHIYSICSFFFIPRIQFWGLCNKGTWAEFFDGFSFLVVTKYEIEKLDGGHLQKFSVLVQQMLFKVLKDKEDLLVTCPKVEKAISWRGQIV